MLVVVRNAGGSDFNGAVTVSVLASQDAAADTGDIALAHSDKRLKLKAGQSKTVKMKASLASVPAGNYTLLGTATANNLTSFVAGPSVNVQAAFVHLVSGGAATPPKKPIVAGKKATLSVPLRNDGNVATTKTPATYTLIFSSDGTEAGAVYQTTSSGKLSLKPGAAKAQKVNVVVPAGSLAAGTYTVIMKVSAELNDTNGQILTAIPATAVG